MSSDVKKWIINKSGKIWLNKFSISNLRKKNYHGKQNCGKKSLWEYTLWFLFHLLLLWIEYIGNHHHGSLSFLVGIFILTLYKRMLRFRDIPYNVHFTQWIRGKARNGTQVYLSPKLLLCAQGLISALLDVFRVMIIASLSFKLNNSILGLPDRPQAIAKSVYEFGYFFSLVMLIERLFLKHLRMKNRSPPCWNGTVHSYLPSKPRGFKRSEHDMEILYPCVWRHLPLWWVFCWI